MSLAGYSKHRRRYASQSQVCLAAFYVTAVSSQLCLEAVLLRQYLLDLCLQAWQSGLQRRDFVLEPVILELHALEIKFNAVEHAVTSTKLRSRSSSIAS